jgi:hypothetical protein
VSDASCNAHAPLAASPPGNTLGIVGFVFSLLGVVTCGLLGPVGLLLSLLALFKRPRGFATAGAVIGLLATLWLGLLGAGMVAGFARLKPVVEQMTGELVQLQATLQAVTQASQEVVQHRDQQGDWPDEKVGQEIVGRHQDAYGTLLKYTRVGEMVLIISAGKDGEFATPDDISLDPVTMSTNQPGGQVPLDFDD